MKKGLLLLILILGTSLSLLSQPTSFNAPVSETANLQCTVISPLTVNPTQSSDMIQWPTLVPGSKYFIGQLGNRERGDFYSIFTFSGEPGLDIEISITPQRVVNNVEISFTMMGSSEPYLGQPSTPTLSFQGNSEVVTLSSTGAYYLHIQYDWVWAYDNAARGIRHFVQTIDAHYNSL